METKLRSLDYPEIFLGFVSAIGADLTPSINVFRHLFSLAGYRVIEIKVTDLFRIFEPYVVPKLKLERTPQYEKLRSYIAYGNQLRETFDDNATLAAATIRRLIRKRQALAAESADQPFEKTVFLLYQFKRKEEVDLLRSVYGRLFFQISAYSRKGARIDRLARTFARTAGRAHSDDYKEHAEQLVKQDANEASVPHGQRVSKIFHDADFIINLDSARPTFDRQIERFFEILFSSNRYSPSKMEYGMFAAKAAAMRSLDLSRQVGAAIFSQEGEVTSLGSNEVPKAGGGTYWSDGEFDARDYTLGFDPNAHRKIQNLRDLFSRIKMKEDEIDKLLASDEVRDSQMMDALEYGRVLHAEMNAIADAGRLGRSTKDQVLYCTTFPCHMCAKQIITAGISNVVFLEPYPKSLVEDLHPDAVNIESTDRGGYAGFPAVKFDHFSGITPRRYREFFDKVSRKNSSDDFENYEGGRKRPFIDIKRPYYADLETQIESLSLKTGIETGLFADD